MNTEKISVVIPVYGCREALFPLHNRLTETLNKTGLDYEIILVNDFCPQNSWEDIVKICEQDKKVIGLNMSRNFGQINAITAGLDNCSGDYVVVMDCDLQDRPEGIPDMLAKLNEGYDIVFARRIERQDKFLTKLLSKAFYKVYDYFSDGNYDPSICNFSISRKTVIDNYVKMREQNRSFTIFIKWLGFRTATIDLQHDKRAAGKSSYDFKRKFKMAKSIITAQSNKPLHFSIALGFVMALISFLTIIYLFIKFIVSGNVPTGWTSLICSIYLIGGFVLMGIGILGIYIGNIFNEVKQRPLYVLQETKNLTESDEK